MGLAHGFIGIEALKQAGALICSDDPSALGVDLHTIVDSMRSLDMEPKERDCLSLAREALAIDANPALRFTVIDSVIGAVADSLNWVLDSAVCQSRFARRESDKIASAIEDSVATSTMSAPRL